MAWRCTSSNCSIPTGPRRRWASSIPRSAERRSNRSAVRGKQALEHGHALTLVGPRALRMRFDPVEQGPQLALAVVYGGLGHGLLLQSKMSSSQLLRFL